MLIRRVSPKGRSIRVTFAVPADQASTGVAVAGSFNNWSLTAHPMKLDRRRGLWKRSVSFRPGERVEFRYFIDGSRWHNEAEADATAASPFFSENSVLVL